MAEQEMQFSLNDMLFVALVRDFESMAMVGFGKLVDPVSQSADRNMERAKVAIDMLGMLEEKTKGNLNDSEVALLQQVLTNLRLNFVDEMEKEKAEKTEKAEKPEGDDGPAAENTAPEASQGKTAETTPEGAEQGGDAPDVSGAKSEAKPKSATKKTRKKSAAGEGKDGAAK
jgi:hypothetical protein